MLRENLDAAAATGSSAQRSILIEGWRTTNHSLALANRYQALELLKLPGLRVFHRDAPLHFTAWRDVADNTGLPPADRRSLDGLTDPGEGRVDCLYRIFSPFKAGTAGAASRTVTYIVTELGLRYGSFAPGSERPDAFMRDDDGIVTPSRWSRDRLIEWGFPADRVSIVPHGVDGAHFRPLAEAERQASRRILGIAEDEVVFLNIGAGIWNKGVDILLLAFAHLHGAGRRIRLILRDRIDMYGLSIAGDISKLAAKNPGLFTSKTMAAVTVIQDDMSRDHLRLLYGAADCYVSPYRAEGFNLPVLEAIACGTPVIVTRGGATDDFCDDRVAVRVRGVPGEHADAAEGHHGRFITPDIVEVVDVMDCFARRQDVGLDRSGAVRRRLVEQFSWRSAAVQLAALACGWSEAR